MCAKEQEYKQRNAKNGNNQCSAKTARDGQGLPVIKLQHAII